MLPEPVLQTLADFLNLPPHDNQWCPGRGALVEPLENGLGWVLDSDDHIRLGYRVL